MELEESQQEQIYHIGALGTCPRSNFMQFSANIFQIMGFCPKLRGCPPPILEILVLPLHQCNLLCIKSEHTTNVYRNCKPYIRMLTQLVQFAETSGGSRISLRWGCQPSRGHQHTILPKFPENCMKLKEFGPRGTARPS